MKYYAPTMIIRYLNLLKIFGFILLLNLNSFASCTYSINKNSQIDSKYIQGVKDTITIKGLNANMDSLKNRFDTLHIKVENESLEKNYSLIISIVSLIFGFILFIIALRQFKIILVNEKSFLAGTTYIEIVNNLYLNNEIDLLQHGANLFLELTNTSKNAITDIWIKFPDCLKLKIEFLLPEHRILPIKYAHIDKVILPERNFVILFDKTYLFNNLSLEEGSSTISIKYKGLKEKKYKMFNFDFSIKNQQSHVKSEYVIGSPNVLKLENGQLIAYEDRDWNNVKI